MNIWQIAKQIKYALIARKWEGNASNQVVFGTGSVHITNGYQERAAENFRYPIALIGVGPGSNDPQIPGNEKRTVRVLIATRILGDMIGENSVVGANRQGTNRSEGRGILEVEEEVKATIKQMQKALGIIISYRAVASDIPTVDEQSGMTTWMGLEFEADCVTDRSYKAPTDLVATGGVGSVTLTWAVPATRFDLRRVRLIRKAGSTQPASISDGTEVALASDLATSKVDTVAGGVYSYTLFACYDETNSRDRGLTPSADERFSSVDVGSYRAGVVVT